MTIKSDKWIRRMALEKGMIHPFVEHQVRKGVVSYGLSSYGYDIRVADEFKVFTNVHSTIVDPKKFDASSFVDFKADTCIIPPNSFALARTVEYLKIPRNVLTICLGKSTYARCFRGDTRVSLVDGSAPTLEDMARRAESGEQFWGYSMSEFGRIVVTALEAPRFIGRDSLLELELDNGRLIHCTPDHEFFRRDGRRVIADELRPNDSLMPLYRHLVRGYETVYQPLNGHLDPTHKLADEWNVNHGLYEALPGTHRHHRDHDRRNNNPWNIERMAAEEHVRHHNTDPQGYYGEDFDAVEHGAAVREAIQALSQNPEWRENYTRMQRERAVNFWNEDQYAAARARLRESHKRSWTDARRAEHAEILRQRFADPAIRAARSELTRAAWAGATERRVRQAEIARGINLRGDIDAEVVRKALNDAGSIRGAARLLNVDRSAFRRFKSVVDEVMGRVRRPGRQPGGSTSAGPGGSLHAPGSSIDERPFSSSSAPFLSSHAVPRNHKIAAIRAVAGEHDVYCLTVPEAGNFALDAGVFTQNCGIIVNVTPFEPEWEGYATLEISNTTPLPARVYANEGLCQVLFFESDEPCETSYADKKGKYQGQGAEIVLPRL